MTSPARLYVYLAIAFGGSALWAVTPYFSPIAWIVLALAWMVPLAAERRRPAPAGPAASRAAALITLAVTLPAFFFLISTWTNDFPFLGDHNVHLRYLQESYAFYTSLAIEQPLGFATRYPGFFHLLALPANLIAHAFDWSAPINIGRLTNALAIPAWLLILRPKFVRRWPDARVLAPAAFLFLQKDVLYYFTSTYLEPWSVILVLTAIEAAIERGREAADDAMLLVGLAAMVKEQAVFVLPFLALWSLERGAIRHRLIVAFVAAAPFISYYDVRRHAGVWRTAGMQPLADVFTTERLLRYAQRTVEQFGLATIVVIALAIALLVLATRRSLFAAIAAAAAFQALFFFTDRLAFDWVAYPRLQLVMLVLLAAPLFLAPPKLAVVIAILNAIPLVSFLMVDQFELNGFEHSDAPIYLPVKQLFAEGEQRGILKPAETVAVLSNIHGVRAGYAIASLPLAYPRIAAAHPLEIIPLDARTLERCRCTESRPAVAAFFVYAAPEHRIHGPLDAMRRIADECDRRVQTSCTSRIALRHRDQLVGLLGGN
jgi:hypothetical protein